MRKSISFALSTIALVYLVACAQKSSAKGQTTFGDTTTTVSSIPSSAGATEKQALTGAWGLVNFTCASGHPITPFGAMLVQAKSTTLTFNNGVMQIYSTLGGCSFVNYNVVAVSGDKLIYNGGHAYGRKECQGQTATTKGISNDPADSYTLQGDRLILKSLSSGTICPRGDTIVAKYEKLSLI